MLRCYNNGDFRKYFNENMKGLNLPVPSTLFGSFTAAVTNAGLILEALKTLGKRATMAEIIKATTGLERLKVVASLGATFYVGAVIGSIAVASGRSMGCGARISDMFMFLHQNNLAFENWNSFYFMHPEILDVNNKSRFAFHSRAIASAKRAYA